MYTVYILQSKSKSRYYIGCTKDVNLRLYQHNKGKVKSTKQYRPWVLGYFEGFQNKKLAFNREKEIKSYKGGNSFEKLIKKNNHI